MKPSMRSMMVIHSAIVLYSNGFDNNNPKEVHDHPWPFIGPYRVLLKHLLIVKIFSGCFYIFHKIHYVNPLNINGIPNNVFIKILNHDLGQTLLSSFLAPITSFPIFFTASPPGSLDKGQT